MATLVKPIPPSDLESIADVVVEAEVVQVRSGFDPQTQSLARYITLQVQQIYRGLDPGMSQVTLREAGGQWSDWSHHVTGVPNYSVGDFVLAFLEQREDGTLRTAGMHQGVFKIDTVQSPRNKRTVKQFTRDLSARGTFPITHRSQQPEAWTEREFRPVLRRAMRRGLTEDNHAGPISIRSLPPEWDRIRWDPGPGHSSPTSIVAPSVGTTSGIKSLDIHGSKRVVAPHFNPLSPSAPARWEDGAQGTPVTFNVDPTAPPITPYSTTITQITRAMDAWSEAEGSLFTLQTADTNYNYISAGHGSPSSVYTGINIILFDDPYNDISDPVNCSGTLGIGGYWSYSGPLVEENGQSFRPIAQGYVILADNFGCMLSDTENLAELMVHELGHAIGFGHSSVNDAAMRSSLYGNNRGPRLGTDDEDAVHCHYPHDYTWLTPSSGQVLTEGDLAAVTWNRSTSAGADGTVVLEYRESASDPWVSIQTNLDDDGDYNWSVPALDSSDVQLRIRRPNLETQSSPYPESCTEVLSAAFTVEPAAVVSAGTVPRDTSQGSAPVLVNKSGLNNLTITWADSCTGQATGYAIYQGDIGTLRAGVFNPTPSTCMAGTDLTETILAPLMDSYFLVVPIAETYEGSMGVDSSNVERGLPVSMCAPREADPVGCP